MRCLFILASVSLVTACASSSQTFTADGKVGHSLNCSGTARNWGMCEQKAGELCGAKGYNILSTTGDRGVIATAGSGGNFFLTSTISRTMLVACKE
jgi:hypothetical protein